jgi:hypothetical protein
VRLYGALSSRSWTRFNLRPPCWCITAFQAWTTGGSIAKCQVPLHRITAGCNFRGAWYRKSAASPFRPFQISIVSNRGIFIAVDAAARNMASMSVDVSSGVRSFEVRTSDFKLSHFQRGLTSKKWVASMMKDAATCSRLRLVSASILPTFWVGFRRVLHSPKTSNGDCCIVHVYC